MVEIPPKPWPTGIAEQVEPLVRRVLAPNPSPYTYTGTETYIVGTGPEVAVIDPGPAGTGEAGHADTHGAGHVEAILAAIGDARLVAIVCTHTHRDHSPAARPLKAATGAPIVGCAPLVLADAHLDYVDYQIDHRPWLAGATMSLADLAAAAQISVADYLGGLDWSGHEQARGWYSVFKSRPSFRPLLAERMDGIQPPAHYADVDG